MKVLFEFCIALYSCLPLTASVEVAETSPSATLVIFLSLPLLPTETSLEDETVELFPNATEFWIPASIVTLLPRTKLLSPFIVLSLPKA